MNFLVRTCNVLFVFGNLSITELSSFEEIRKLLIGDRSHSKIQSQLEIVRRDSLELQLEVFKSWITSKIFNNRTLKCFSSEIANKAGRSMLFSCGHVAAFRSDTIVRRTVGFKTGVEIFQISRLILEFRPKLNWNQTEFRLKLRNFQSENPAERTHIRRRPRNWFRSCFLFKEFGRS